MAVVYKQEGCMSVEALKAHLSPGRVVRLAGVSAALALGAPVAVAAVHTSKKSKRKDTTTVQ